MKEIFEIFEKHPIIGILFLVIGIILFISYGFINFAVEYSKLSRSGKYIGIKRELTNEEKNALEAIKWMQSVEGREFIGQALIEEMIKEENYEDAAKIRDVLNQLNNIPK